MSMSKQQLEWYTEGYNAYSNKSKQPNGGFGARAYYWRKGWHDASIIAEQGSKPLTKTKDNGIT